MDTHAKCELLILATVMLYLFRDSRPSFCNGSVIQPLGAYHHARGIMIVLYTINISVFKSQLTQILYLPLINVTSLAMFLTIQDSRMLFQLTIC